MSITSPDGKITIEPDDGPGASFFRKLTQATDWKSGFVIPLLAVFTALVIGAIIILAIVLESEGGTSAMVLLSTPSDSP